VRDAIPGLTVVLLHHPRKAGDAERGHTSVKGALDGQFWMEVADKMLGLIKFRVEKLKDADDTFQLDLKRKIVEVDEVDPNTGKAITACVLVEADAKDRSQSSEATKRKVLEFVKRNPGINRSRVHEALKIKREDSVAAINSLIFEQRLAEQKQGRAKLLTFVSFTVAAGTPTF
jgi:hypothetical protein